MNYLWHFTWKHKEPQLFCYPQLNKKSELLNSTWIVSHNDRLNNFPVELITEKKTFTLLGAKNNYPIMARDHEVISTKAPIPKGILLPYYIDIICYQPALWAPVVRHAATVDILYYVSHAKRKKENVRFMGSPSSEGVHLIFNFTHELSFYCIDAGCGSAVNDRWLSFVVCPYLEPFLHLDITPDVIARCNNGWLVG